MATEPQSHRATEQKEKRDFLDDPFSSLPLWLCGSVSLCRYLPSSTMKRVSTPLARISGAYIA
jgi:hypothetical protein